jgi:hypothetical protein
MFLLPLLLALPDFDVGSSKNFSKEQQTKALLATVRIVNEGDRLQGSGVMIRQNGTIVYALTADHLVGKAETVEVTIFSSKAEKVVKHAKPVARVKEADVVLLRFEMREPVACVPLCPSDSLPKDADFPVLLADGSQEKPALLEETARGKKRVRKPNAGEATSMWEVSGQPSKGRSGGPMIDRQGFVVGLGSGMNGEKAYYTHVDEIHACLRANGFRWLFDPKEK